jgi:hypothetical protein
MEGGVKRELGINLLISVYGIVIFGNISKIVSSYETYANKVHSLLLIAVLVFLIIGFLKRINVARVMAIIFHLVLQIYIFVSVFSIFDAEFSTQVIKHIFEPGAIVLVILIFAILAISIPNIIIIKYLVRNKGYFSIKKS